MLTSARSFRRVLRVLARITSGLGLSLASRNSTHSAGENICRKKKAQIAGKKDNNSINTCGDIIYIDMGVVCKGDETPRYILVFPVIIDTCGNVATVAQMAKVTKR